MTAFSPTLNQTPSAICIRPRGGLRPVSHSPLDASVWQLDIDNYWQRFIDGFIHYHDIAAYPQVLIPIIGGGLIADLVYVWLKPSRTRLAQTHAFAFLVPFELFAIFIAVLVSTTHVQWTVQMWTGVPILAGVVGLLISLATAPVTGATEH